MEVTASSPAATKVLAKMNENPRKRELEALPCDAVCVFSVLQTSNQSLSRLRLQKL